MSIQSRNGTDPEARRDPYDIIVTAMAEGLIIRCSGHDVLMDFKPIHCLDSSMMQTVWVEQPGGDVDPYTVDVEDVELEIAHAQTVDLLPEGDSLYGEGCA